MTQRTQRTRTSNYLRRRGPQLRIPGDEGALILESLANIKVQSSLPISSFFVRSLPPFPGALRMLASVVYRVSSASIALAEFGPSLCRVVRYPGAPVSHGGLGWITRRLERSVRCAYGRSQSAFKPRWRRGEAGKAWRRPCRTRFEPTGASYDTNTVRGDKVRYEVLIKQVLDVRGVWCGV